MIILEALMTDIEIFFNRLELYKAIYLSKQSVTVRDSEHLIARRGWRLLCIHLYLHSTTKRHLNECLHTILFCHFFGQHNAKSSVQYCTSFSIFFLLRSLNQFYLSIQLGTAYCSLKTVQSYECVCSSFQRVSR